MSPASLVRCFYRDSSRGMPTAGIVSASASMKAAGVEPASVGLSRYLLPSWSTACNAFLEREGIEPSTDDTLQGYPSVFARSFRKVSRRYLIAE